MSKTTKWVIAIIVIIIIVWVVWSKGMLTGTSQSAAVVNNNAVNSVTNNTPGNTSKDQIVRDAATIDAQVQASNSGMALLGTNPTQAQIVAAANQLKTVAGLMTALRIKLQSAAVSSKSATVKAAITDLGVQVSNGSSQEAAVLNNTAKISATATVSTSDALKATLAQLASSASYLVAAQADIHTAVAGL